MENKNQDDMKTCIEALNIYLCSVCQTLLSVSQDRLYQQLHLQENQSVILSFMNDAQNRFLVIQKESSPNQPDHEVLIEASVKIGVNSTKRHSLLFLKRISMRSKILETVGLSQQLQILNLGYYSLDANPFEISHNYVQNCFVPIFNTYKNSVKIQNQADQDSFNFLYKKLNELNRALIQCQNSIEVPEINLQIDPLIKEVCEAARAKGQKVKQEDLGDKLNDQEYLAQLVDYMTKWIQDIMIVTKRNFEITQGTQTVQEINYWLSFERSLHIINQQIQSDEVQLTHQVLKFNRKMQITTAFETDLNFQAIYRKCIEFNQIMKDFPINDLISAQNIIEINQALLSIFQHIKKISQVDTFSGQTAFYLLESISRDLNNQMLKCLQNVKLMDIKNSEFSKIMQNVNTTFQTWENQVNVFKDNIRRQKNFNTNSINSIYEHTSLKERCELIQRLRKNHERMKKVINGIIQQEKLLRQFDNNFIKQMDVNEPFKAFNGLDVLDLTREGDQQFYQARQNYENNMEHVEKNIIVKLRDKLGSVQSSNELFKIFQKFNSLFFKPKIKGAVVEYQSQLLKTVQSDIDKLRTKFLSNYKKSHVSTICQFRDIPPVGGNVIWTQQIKRKLQTYMERVEDILGSDWQSTNEGSSLQEIAETFEKHLNNTQLIDNWNRDITFFLNQIKLNEKIFAVVQKKKLEIVVNYDDRVISLFKEIRNLNFSKIKITAFLTFTADDSQKIYPWAVSLQDSIQSFNQVSNKINDKLARLIANYRKEVIDQLWQGVTLCWNFRDLISPYTKKLNLKVSSLEDAVHTLIQKSDQIQLLIIKMGKGNFANLKIIIKEIQSIIDEFSFKSFSNLDIYVYEINLQIEQILIKKLNDELDLWIKDFQEFDIMKQNLFDQPIILELKLQEKVISLDPSIEFCKLYLYKSLHKLIGKYCNISRLESGRYEQKQENNNYSDILNKLNIKPYYQQIEQQLRNVQNYVNTWLNYEALYQIDINTIQNQLEENIDSWNQMLQDIKDGRQTFDNSETQKEFGVIFVDYRQIQVKIFSKYDSWHKEILNLFGNNHQKILSSFFKQLINQKNKLENVNFQNQSLDILANISIFEDSKSKFMNWQKQMEQLKKGQKVLDNQRFQQPDDYVSTDLVDGAWNTYKQIYQQKITHFDKERTTLQERVIKDENNLKDQIKEMETRWDKEKPYSGDLIPEQALEQLNIIESQMKTIKKNLIEICQAKELLDIGKGNPRQLDSMEQGIEGLREVWIELTAIHKMLEVVMENQLVIVQPKKIKQSLDEIQEKLNEFPSRLRTYEAYDYMKEKIKGYKKVNIIALELKNDGIKPRHQREILQVLELVQLDFRSLTVGQIWNSNIQLRETRIREILATVRGEQIIEKMLTEIKDYWTIFEVELFRYQTKCKIIKGWDDLFTKCDEDLQNLESLKMSQFYKNFEGEVLQWEEKLQQIRTVFDIWTDVQRKWIYLEGIFFGPSDIRTQLQNEYNRFNSINNEFIQLMKQVSNKPRILEIITFQGLQKSLERLVDQLAKIQKALGDYLELQRQAFARFYFVGDPDLLEIIGNSKDVRNVMRHFPKMYAGICQLTAIDDWDTITGMTSKEGEIVNFEKQIIVSQNSQINKWLKMVDDQMMFSQATLLENCFKQLSQNKNEQVIEVIDNFSAQVIILGFQIYFCYKIEKQIMDNKPISEVEQYVIEILNMLSQYISKDLLKTQRQKYEQIITDFVHHRDVTRNLQGVTNIEDFKWQYFMRFYWDLDQKDLLKKCRIQMANALRYYGFEYLGIGDRLVQTPLTDKCYVTLTQALNMRLGGCPFGPAGTGKTESVKALGGQLGQFVLTFNCDETFDLNAMGRIFVGICQVGAWGCFDEFNRLEERMLSAVSQQILTIQTGLIENQNKIDLMGKDVFINPCLGIFITMNPGYAGRSNLPENLKQLFRQMAMVKPDGELIAQVMLYSQGYQSAEKLAGKIVSLFDLCKDQLSNQPHYDFGLRALKCVLVSAGNMKRLESQENLSIDEFEQKILLMSVCNTIMPKLVQDDVPLLSTLLSGVFPGCQIEGIREELLRQSLITVCKQRMLLAENEFIEKILQLYQIQNLQHGVMLVGESGYGKSQAWQTLLEAMHLVDKVKGESYIIDPKAITKDQLYGKMDKFTMEWQDGVFTNTLRKILENQKGESQKRHWIVFDGDVDPEWAENLNSVLDDNRLLTLPNGERLSIPPNVRILFEVETLKYATLATVSRCGMVWFSDNILTFDMIFHHYLQRLQKDNYDDLSSCDEQVTNENKIRKQALSHIKSYFSNTPCVVQQSIEMGTNLKHVMKFTNIRVIESLFALIRKNLNLIVDYQDTHQDFPMNDEVMSKYMNNSVLLALCWGIGGSLPLGDRGQFARKIGKLAQENRCINNCNFDGQLSPIDWQVKIDDGNFVAWNIDVPQVNLSVQQVTDADLIIQTVDTLRHQFILGSWMSEHRAFLICGPPGSGKTMTLMSTLKSLPNCEMIFINFSSTTLPKMLMKQFDHYCEYVKSPKGLFLRPKNPNKWLIIFCDEINLPETDKYGTIPVITFLRQLAEQGGFWREHDSQFIKIERIQFVGACNPPTDVGRSVLSDRFLRHVPLLLVDYPGKESFIQIYGAFNKAMLKQAPTVREYADALTLAQIDVYMENQQHFTAEIQPHYIYSPRELTRWKFAINEAIESVETLDQLVRLWAHEGLRLFQDRLVNDDEKEWCNKMIDQIAYRYFPMISEDTLARPIYFTTYLNKEYVSVDAENLRDYIQARLQKFYEEELNVPIVIFDSVLDHILRIDRVLRQPLGHCLLVGKSGVGKTTLSRFVSWMNNLSVYQIKAGKNYGLAEFDQDLREVMKRAGCKQEKISFIFDESNILSVAFMERMNALLASGEIPGLFEADEYSTLIAQMKEHQKNSTMMDDDQLYRCFIQQVQRNLHVVFTMNPAGPDFSDRGASSPALYNRCVIDWFGDWPDDALWQVSREFTKNIDSAPESFTENIDQQQREDIIISHIVNTHKSVDQINDQLQKAAKRFNYLTPRDFIDFIKHFTFLYNEKKSLLEEQHLHLNKGLDKLVQTGEQVAVLKSKLEIYKQELDLKQREANQKLQLMVAKQQEAQTKKDETQQVKISVERESSQAQQKEIQVEKELSEALPALEAAKKSVSNISKKDLVELKSFLNPTNVIKLTMTAVIVLITNQKKTLEWSEVKLEFNKSTFLDNVLNFNMDHISQKCIDFVMTKFVKDKDWDIQKINKASQVAGPLAIWLESSLKFGAILASVEPLRASLKEVKEKIDILQKELEEKEQMIEELSNNIKQYEADYAELIAQVNQIKNEMQVIVNKVTRSDNLLINLQSERERWSDQVQNFKTQMASTLGDCLVSSAFLAYIGFFDFYYRRLLLSQWNQMVESKNILQRDDFGIITYLSNSNDNISWQSHGLPGDDLCVENAIILKRFNKYPLIIDPSGQAFEFITSFYKDKKLTKTSFADDSFTKNLETCLRFGCPLLIQDVEKIDPILTTVLNKELYKTGGRILIRVGDAEIDFVSTFNLFMITRDQNSRFTPDVCSRVTFVNFTVTPSSLENQCLNIFMKNERPDIEEKRIKQLKIQGEFKFKLRNQEDKLLETLSNSQGNILDDEKVINTLEKLKVDASEILQAIEESGKVMDQIQEVSDFYLPLSKNTSKIYFSMINLLNIHYLYEYSLQFFLETLHQVITCKAIKENNDSVQRLAILNKEIYIQIYHRVSPSLLVQDKLIFGLNLFQIKSDDKLGNAIQCMIRTPQNLGNNVKDIFSDKLTNSQMMYLEEISENPYFSNLLTHIRQNKKAWLDFQENNISIPDGWQTENEQTEIGQIVRICTIYRVFKPDKFDQMAKELVAKSLDSDVLNEKPIELQQIVENEVTSKVPILMCSAAGFDASYKVELLAKQQNKKLTSIAIGGQQGFDLADKAISQASKSGQWVLLKNVHLAPKWLGELEKKLFRLTTHQNFRIFLSMEFNPNVPGSLIRQSFKIVYEPPSGIKASLIRTYRTVFSPERCNKAPCERGKLHFLVAWLHAIIIERLRYLPIGWSKKYEFNEADQRCSLDLIDELIDSKCSNSRITNIDPEKIPFESIRTILSQNLYGGKIDNQYDLQILKSLIDQLFTEKAFQLNYPLFEAENPILIPDVIKYDQFFQWIDQLPSIEQPEWCGLPNNVEKLIKIINNNRVIDKVWELNLNSAQEEAIQQSSSESSQKVQWLVDLGQKIEQFEKVLPTEVKKPQRTKQNLQDPLFRFLEREVCVGQDLLNNIKQTFETVKDLINEVKTTAQVKKLAKELYNDIIPAQWNRYQIQKLSINEWMVDFSKRIKQLNSFVDLKQYQKQGVWLGGIMYPEAFMTATRQYVAQNNGWSLEELELEVSIYKDQQIDDDSFIIKGMNMEGVNFEDEKIKYSPKIINRLPDLVFKWIQVQKDLRKTTKSDELMVPVYLNPSRLVLLFSVKMNCSGIEKHILYQKGIAFISWHE